MRVETEGNGISQEVYTEVLAPMKTKIYWTRPGKVSYE